MAPAEPRPDLSIVIVNYNTRDYLQECLHSIYEHPPRLSFEVFVVDNHSSDGSCQMVRECFPQVKTVAFERNLGYVKANNHAIRDSAGRFLLLLNSDTRMRSGSLDALVDFMRERPDAGIVGCKQVDMHDRLQLTWGKFPSLKNEIIRKAMHQRLVVNGSTVRDYLSQKYQETCDVDWVAGSCMMVRREVCREVGLMDENIFMYFEDIDWCHRVKKADWRIYYTPRIEFVHHGGASSDRNKIDALVEYRKSQFYFTRKYFGRPSVILLKVLMGIKSVAGGMAWGVRYMLAPMGSKKRHDALCMLLIFKRTLGLVLSEVRRPNGSVEDN